MLFDDKMGWHRKVQRSRAFYPTSEWPAAIERLWLPGDVDAAACLIEATFTYQTGRIYILSISRHFTIVSSGLEAPTLHNLSLAFHAAEFRLYCHDKRGAPPSTRISHRPSIPYSCIKARSAYSGMMRIIPKEHFCCLSMAAFSPA